MQCPQCRQENAPDERCGKCMWAEDEIPWTLSLPSSSQHNMRLAPGEPIAVVLRRETVPEWVEIRYVPQEQWDSKEFALAFTQRGKSNLRGGFVEEVINHLNPLCDIAANAQNHGAKTIREMIDDAVATASDDHDMVGLILRADDSLRRQVDQYRGGLVAAAGTNSYWITSKLEGKQFLLGVWYTRKMPSGTNVLAVTGHFAPGQPILKLRFSDVTLWAYDVASETSEIAAKEILKKGYELSEDAFEREPNGPTTFPDWNMRLADKDYNVEVTRIRREQHPVYIDQEGWQDRVESAARTSGRLRHTKVMSKKAQDARDSAIPTILVVFNEEGTVDYKDQDLESFFFVVVVDESTGQITVR